MTILPLPNAEHAFIDESKLSGYCLNQHHSEGKHKASIFAAFGISDVFMLKSLLLEAVVSELAVLERIDEYGRLYNVGFYYNAAPVQSIWMIRKGEDFPRLVTCYISQ
ncbi:MAG: hypothetical protein A3F67_07495 [Verrucomicrobia bacterium RIFCSPHIGHO2_12_FULL_41_10]|nr:MAG: hypothetical protein A3F67_07495 [Verrucomicrobia bacterium RIFCSPHIGHO2_12_FULL_41_10]HLB32799.1 hypothetical protein [Chthoniobacterales bacterium]